MSFWWFYFKGMAWLFLAMVVTALVACGLMLLAIWSLWAFGAVILVACIVFSLWFAWMAWYDEKQRE